MKAIVFDGVETSLKNIDKPSIDNKFNTLIKVVYAGICKTDIYMSEGKMSGQCPVVLGHEFSGYVVETLDENLNVGDFVTCNPILNDKTMLGVDYDGAFAEYVKVPSEQCYMYGSGNEKMAAYIEPLAASMAPLEKRNLLMDKKIAIIGKDRIGKLTAAILRQYNLNVDYVDNLQPDEFDVIIETWAQKNVLDQCLDGLKEGGLLILKSRNYQKVPLDLYKIVRKGIRLEGMYYFKDYNEVIGLSKNNTELESFLGPDFSLEQWQKAFSESHGSHQKIFLRMF